MYFMWFILELMNTIFAGYYLFIYVHKYLQGIILHVYFILFEI